MYLLINILFTIPIILLRHLVGFILELRLGADNFWVSFWLCKLSAVVGLYDPFVVFHNSFLT